MKVLFDGSVLGAVHGTRGARAGVFRVVDTLARLLLRREDCEVRLAAAESLWTLRHLVAYAHSQPDLSQAPFGCRSPFDRSISMRHALAKMEAWQNPGIVGRLRRSALYRRMKAVEGTAPEGDYCDYAGHDVYHSPYAALPTRERTGKCGPQRFLTVHDLVPVLFPEYFANLPAQKEALTAAVQSIAPDDWIIAVSECTRRDLCEYRPDLDPDRVLVVHWGASKLFRPHRDPVEAKRIRAGYGVPDAPYVLSLATLEPRKNIEHVIRSFAAWVQQEKIADVNLVLVGERGWGYDDILAEVSRAGALQDRIVITGRVDDADLAAVYSGALAFAYLSFYEGFGLPPLEAMQCGVPVITSDRSSLPEVVGSAAVQLDPQDGDGLADAFQRLWSSADLRAEMSRKSLAQAKGFSWERCTSETVAGYRKALAA